MNNDPSPWPTLLPCVLMLSTAGVKWWSIYAPKEFRNYSPSYFRILALPKSNIHSTTPTVLLKITCTGINIPPGPCIINYNTPPGLITFFSSLHLIFILSSSTLFFWWTCGDVDIAEWYWPKFIHNTMRTILTSTCTYSWYLIWRLQFWSPLLQSMF